MSKTAGCAVTLAVVVFLGMALSVFGPEPAPSTRSPSPPPQDPALRALLAVAAAQRAAQERVDLKVNGWRKTGFGSVAEVDVTLTNRKAPAIKDVGLRCEFKGESGTILRRVERVAYRVFEPSRALRIRDINFGFIPQEARQMSCDVISVSE